jgi:hypothetical protein
VSGIEQGEKHRFILPVYTSAGLNNFKMELRNAAILAKQLGRCLCLEKFTDLTQNKQAAPVSVSDVYNISRLSQFVMTCTTCGPDIHVVDFNCDPTSAGGRIPISENRELHSKV